MQSPVRGSVRWHPHHQVARPRQPWRRMAASTSASPRIRSRTPLSTTTWIARSMGSATTRTRRWILPGNPGPGHAEIHHHILLYLASRLSTHFLCLSICHVNLTENCNQSEPLLTSNRSPSDGGMRTNAPGTGKRVMTATWMGLACKGDDAAASWSNQLDLNTTIGWPRSNGVPLNTVSLTDSEGAVSLMGPPIPEAGDTRPWSPRQLSAATRANTQGGGPLTATSSTATR